MNLCCEFLSDIYKKKQKNYIFVTGLFWLQGCFIILKDILIYKKKFNKYKNVSINENRKVCQFFFFTNICC